MPSTLLLKLRLLQFQPMKLTTPPFLSRSLLNFSHLPLRNAAFRPRPFSARAEKKERVRVSKSLVDDEAELSSWVDELRTGRPDRVTIEPMRSSREPVREDGGFRARKSNRGSALGKRRVDDLRKGRDGVGLKRKFQLSSDDNDDEKEVVVGGKFKGGGSVGEFLSEDDDDEGEEESGEDEEIVNKSRNALFGKKDVVPTTPKPSSTEGSESYLSESRINTKAEE